MSVPARPSRRDLLRRGSLGAAAAGAVWVAPAVLSFDGAGALGSCTTDVLDWSSRGNCFDPNPEITAAPINGVRVFERGGGTTLVQSATGTIPSSAIWSNNAADNRVVRAAAGVCGNGCTTADYPRGNNYSFFSLTMRETSGGCGGAGTTGRWVQTTLRFGDASNMNVFVSALRFTLLDIDSQNGNYRDRVELYINGEADNARQGLAATIASVGTVGSGADLAIDAVTQPTGTCVTLPNGAQAGFEAANSNCSASSTQESGNISVRFLRGVNQVTIRFRDVSVDGSNNPIAPDTIQWVGISNMTWCGTQPAA